MEPGKGANSPAQNTRKVKKLKCEQSSPFEDKVSWQIDFASPVIKNAILKIQQKEQNMDPLKNMVWSSKLKPAANPETHYQHDFIKKDLPLLSRFCQPKDHLLFKGSLLTTSHYQTEFQKNNCKRVKPCKREQTLFKDLDYTQDSKNKSAYMDDFPFRPLKRVFFRKVKSQRIVVTSASVIVLPPLSKKKHSARNRDSCSRKFETETTYLKDYIPFKIDGAKQQTVLRTVARGIVPHLPSVRPDPNFKKSFMAEELAVVAEKNPCTGRLPCRPQKDSILKFDGKDSFGTLYDVNYIDPSKKRWFHGHRLAWKASQSPNMRPRRLPMIAKIVGKPLTWRYV